MALGVSQVVVSAGSSVVRSVFCSVKESDRCLRVPVGVVQDVLSPIVRATSHWLEHNDS
jgi:hypothetical protein